MNRRFVLLAAIVAGVLVALTVSNIRYSPWTNTVARTVDQRGPLSEAERANIELFERVSPSVVQVAARSAGGNPLAEDEGGEGAAGAASGTGFVWDNAGHVVTNNHVVQNGSEVAVRFASGEVAQAEGIGFAIPVDIVNRVVPDLIKNGRVPTPGIGIVAASEAVSTRLGIEGVIIVRTAPGSPAERAGIRGVDFSSGALGDVIVQADGKPVHRLSDLTDQIEQVGAGKSIRISLKRGSQTRDINIDIVDIGRG